MATIDETVQKEIDNLHAQHMDRVNSKLLALEFLKKIRPSFYEDDNKTYRFVIEKSLEMSKALATNIDVEWLINQVYDIHIPWVGFSYSNCGEAFFMRKLANNSISILRDTTHIPTVQLNSLSVNDVILKDVLDRIDAKVEQTSWDKNDLQHAIEIVQSKIAATSGRGKANCIVCFTDDYDYVVECTNKLEHPVMVYGSDLITPHHVIAGYVGENSPLDAGLIVIMNSVNASSVRYRILDIDIEKYYQVIHLCQHE